MVERRRPPARSPRSASGTVRAARLCRIDVIDESAGRVRLPIAKTRAVVAAALAEAGMGPSTLTVLIVDAAGSAALHRQHFADPEPTDVMTFPDGGTDPLSGRVHLGDLAVCADVAMTMAGEHGLRPGDELCLYVLHGVLHLTGYDDVTPGKLRRMWAAQRRLLAAVGITLGPLAGQRRRGERASGARSQAGADFQRPGVAGAGRRRRARR